MFPQCSYPSLTTVLFSSRDAKRFLKELPEVDRVFTLTPDARSTLKNSHIKLLTTLETYTDYDQRRVLARVRRMEKNPKGKLERLGISAAARETLRGQLHVLASFSSRLWETLKNTGPWLLPTPHGWENISNIHEAHRVLLVHISIVIPCFNSILLQEL